MLIEEPSTWFHVGATVTVSATGELEITYPECHPRNREPAHVPVIELDGEYLQLLTHLGRLRGVVHPDCFRGLRAHGYVARVGT